MASTEKDKPKGLGAKILGLLPPWISEALVSRRAWKTWVRCMIATLVSIVFMLVQKTLNMFGAAGFFGLIASQMLPPSLPFSIYLFALSTLGIGMVLGWAWGCAAMAAGLRARSASLLLEQQQSFQASLDPNVPVALQSQMAAFAGHFLDPRSSAVFGVFIFIGAYFFGLMRALSPKLTLLSIFATIIMDLMCSFGPLLPTANYMIAKQLITPAAVFMATGLVCTVLFFPQSLSHQALHDLVHKGLQPLQAVLELQDEVLATRPSDVEAWGAMADRARGLRMAFIMATSGLEAQAKMLQLEISHGRISAGELDELIRRTRELGARGLGLSAFVVMIQELHTASKELKDKPLPHYTARVTGMRDAYEKASGTNGRSLDELLPQVADATADLRTAAEEGLRGAIAWLDELNNTRWKKIPADSPAISVRQAAIVKLQTALTDFRENKHFTFLAPFQSMFDPTTGKLNEDEVPHLAGSVRGLFRCFILTSSLISFSCVLVDYLEFLVLLEQATPKNKFQFPGKFREELIRNVNDSTGGDNDYNIAIGDRLADNDGDSSTQDDDDSHFVTPKDDKKEKKVKQWRINPDAGAPRNALQRFGRTMAVVGKAVSSTNGIFALKYAIASLALWIPAVHPSSARFNYDNKGLWALIMAQTGMGIYTGEQIYSFVTRMTGTIAGAVIGMVVWYIGAQRGSGNPYGIAAATMVFIGPFLFIRIVAPPAEMGLWIMVAVTIVFVVGYSWVDEHLFQVGNQGAGYTLAGRRALLVIIGFAAAFIIMLFPKPVSAKKLVRQGISKNIGDIAHLYAREVTAFEQSRDSDDTDVNERRERYRSHILKIFGRMQAIQERMAYANFEPGMQGPWPKHHYERLVKTQGSMLSASSVLSTAYSQINNEWCRRLTSADIMHPSFTADCISLFTILRHSLRYGVKLPPTIPIFERLAYHRSGLLARWQVHKEASRMASRNASQAAFHAAFEMTPGKESADSPGTENGGSGTNGGDTRAGDDGPQTDTEALLVSTFTTALTWQACHEEQFTIFATAIVAIAHIVGGLSQMHRTILDLVGEHELEGFDLAHERWAYSEV